MNIRPIRVEFPQATLDDLRDRLLRVRWPNEIPNTGWEYGTNLAYMKTLVEYWVNDYDWHTQADRLNQFPHFKADVDGLGIHFLKAEGKGPNPMPLLMLHGYPYPWTVKPGVKVQVPTGLAAFPKDIVPIIKSQSARTASTCRRLPAGRPPIGPPTKDTVETVAFDGPPLHRYHR